MDAPYYLELIQIAFLPEDESEIVQGITSLIPGNDGFTGESQRSFFEKIFILK